MKRQLFVLTLLLAAFAPSAQAAHVRGRVYAGDGATPYPSVSVALLDANGKGPTVYTDHQGMFRIDNVAPGSYSLVVVTPRSRRSYGVAVQPREFTDLAPVTVP